MALKGNTREEMIWNFLKENIVNNYGVAALMGNLDAESGLNPKNLENLCEKRLKETGKDYCTDETYTAAVDTGKISRAEFLHPLPNKQYGYGLAQWTSAGRKAGLYDLVKSKGVSIGDLETQLEFLIKELSTSYKGTLSILKTATSVRMASDKVLTGFECPTDQSESMKIKRAGFGQKYYDAFAKANENFLSNSIIIGSARHDENGKYSGGTAGDQTQKSSSNDMNGEVSMQTFYVHKSGWYILRPISKEHADAIAERMTAACNNPNIGYCQRHRLGIVSAGINTRTVTECDCSSLIRQVVKEATGKDAGNFTTANEVSRLEETGLFQNKVAYSANAILYNGDILVTKTKGHTVAVVKRNPRKGDEVVAQQSGKIKKLAPAMSKDNSKAGTYRTTCDVNIRYGSDKDKYDSIKILSKGEQVTCYGYYTNDWLYVATFDKKEGFIKSTYLDRCKTML